MVEKVEADSGEERALRVIEPCRASPVRIISAPAPRHDNSTSLNNNLNVAQTAIAWKFASSSMLLQLVSLATESTCTKHSFVYVAS